MEYNYLILLHGYAKQVIIIKLSHNEKIILKSYNDPEDFIREYLEDKYCFNLSDCSWQFFDEYKFIMYRDEEQYI